MGWNWVTNLAQYCKLHVIAEGEWKKEVEEAISKLPQSQNITFHFILVSDKVRKMANNQGDWRFYWYYRQWQKRAYDKAVEIINREHIDVVHQLNMIGFREPGYLWKIKNKPFVWGPIGGMGGMPMAYLSDAKLSLKLFFRLKNTLNTLQTIFHPRVRKALHRAEVHVCATPETMHGVKLYYGIQGTYLSETGCYPMALENNNAPKEGFNIVWVGKFDFRKQLQLALLTMSQLKQYSEIKLHICGSGDAGQETYYKNMANELQLQDSVIWHGQVPHDQIIRDMASYKLMLFTSINDATSTVLMEAIQNKLPVICFDTCGMGAVVDDSIGYKVKLTNPAQSIKDFASAILYLYQHPEELKRKAEACGNKIAELSWDSKAVKMVELYHEAIRKFKQKHPAKS